MTEFAQWTILRDLTKKYILYYQAAKLCYHLQKKAFANRPNLISEPIKKLLPRYLVMSHIEVKKIY
jgi:hypothetical protein